jgi:predicted ATPase
MTSKVLAEPVLVGREHELEELQSSLNSAINGKGTTIFVSGEAGAGKTRLVTEFLNQAKKQEVTILTGWCLNNAAVPYFPFFEAFNRYFSSEPEQKEIEVKSWLMGPSETGQFGRVQMITPQVWKDQTFTAVANTLASISAKHPVILFIDDVHWADSASLALIHYLAKTINSEKVLVIATFRSEQLVADVEGRPHPLLETLRLMRREDTIKEILVNSLDQTGVSTLAKNMLGGELQQDLSQKLAEQSQGNPLFVVESLRMLSEGNGLIQEQNQWRLNSAAIGIPPKIKDIILQRLSALGRNQKNVLEIASVLGEKFDADLLASVLSQDSIEVISILDIIAKDTSLVRCEGELYRFDHGRTRDAIYDDISPALKRVYHGKAAEKLEIATKDGKVPFSDLAYQYAQAGNKEKAVKYALTAGQDALAKWSNGEAIKHFTFVVQTIRQNPKQNEELAIALEGLADAFYASNNFTQAITAFEQVADIQNDAAKLRALRKALQASFYQGDVSIQKALIRKAENVKTADRLETTRLLHLKTSIFQTPDDLIAAIRLWPEVLKVYEEEYAVQDAANILLWIGFGQACSGKLEVGVACALRSIAIYDDLGDFRSQMEAYAYAGGTFQACMFVDESNRMLSKANEVNEQYKIWDYVRLFPAFVWEAMNLIQTDIPRAVSTALKALEYFQKTDSYLYAGPVNGILIVSYALADDIAHVDEYYGKLMNLPKYILQNAPTQIYIGPVMLTYYAAKGEFEKSQKCFNDWIKTVNAVFPSPFVDASARQLYAWGLGKQGKMEEAKAQLEEAQKIIGAAKERFIHTNILPYLATFIMPEVNQNFPIRIDLVNVSFVAGSIVKIANLPDELEIVEVSPNCVLRSGQIEFLDNRIGCFEVKTVKLTVKSAKQAKKSEFILNPKVTFINDLGETKTSNPRPLTMTVQLTQPRTAVIATTKTAAIASIEPSVKPFNVFLCYKKSSAKDFADHLKSGLEELGLHTFLDSKDIPVIVDGQIEWAKIRDKALQESKIFILIMTPGFDLSSEVQKELNLARKQGDKEFVYFRHRNMGRKIMVQLENQVLDIGKQEQVSFETKEELLRLAHNILFKESTPRQPSKEMAKGSDSEIDILKKFGLSRASK